MMVLAHVGHWYAEALYVLPVILVIAWTTLSGRRERRRKAREDGTPARRGA